MWIAGPLVTFCTFPGVLVHQLFYLLASKAYSVPTAFSLLNLTHFLSPDLVTIGESDRLRVGGKLEAWAVLGSALVAGSLGALNEVTPKESAAEWALFWIAISIGVQSFPLRKTKVGKAMAFVWIDAFYGFMLYLMGQAPHAALVTWFPSLGLTGTRLY